MLLPSPLVVLKMMNFLSLRVELLKSPTVLLMMLDLSFEVVLLKSPLVLLMMFDVSSFRVELLVFDDGFPKCQICVASGFHSLFSLTAKEATQGPKINDIDKKKATRCS